MKPIVELENVTFGYGKTAVLDQINFHMHDGQFAALVGPSGAGKTTLLKLVLGVLSPSHGNLLCQPNLRIAYVPQVETVDWNFPVTAEEIVLMGLSGINGRFPWSTRAEKERARALLEELGIGEMAQRHIRDLSGGQQQRIFLARALIAEPELLVLDEPTSGVDLRSAENIFHQLAHLNQDGISILLTTHDLNMAAAHAPWIVCLNQTVIAQGSPDDVMTDAVLSETYQGEMIVIRQDDMIFIQQKPHTHGVQSLIPEPICGGLVGHDEIIDN